MDSKKKRLRKKNSYVPLPIKNSIEWPLTIKGSNFPPLSSEDQSKFAGEIGFQLVKSVVIEIGSPDQSCYQYIEHKPCRECKKEWVETLDIARGYPTYTMEDLCRKCAFTKRQIPFLMILS